MYTTAQELTMNQRFARILVASVVFAAMCLAASPAAASPKLNSRRTEVSRRDPNVVTHRKHDNATVLYSTLFVPVATVGDTGMTAAEYTAFLNSQAD
jgi:hypothetical protein